MSEPSTAIPLIVIGGTSVAAAFPGVDAMTVMGAGAGAGMFVFLAYWLPNFWIKLGYFAVSWIFGVVYASQGWYPEWLSGVGQGVKGFASAFAIVMLCTSVMEFVRTGKLPGWVSELIKLRLSRRGDQDA